MAHYEYAPIEHLQHAFRLVLLRAGTVVDYDIECELIDALADDDDILPYEALSYTWGSDYPLKTIQIGGRTMSVRTNLHAALEHLRLPHQDRLLWIDAICIDQKNDTEKAHQVQQMSNIYKRAEHVVVWLGLLEQSSSLLMDSLGVLERLFRGIKYTSANRHKWESAWTEIQGDSGDTAHAHLQGLQAILAHPWFRRGWIIQEIANARRATIYCSSHSISCKIFAVAPELLHLTVDRHCNSILELMAGPKDRPVWWSEGRDLHTLLHKFSHAETSISRDAVFALLGICETQSIWGNGQGGLVADYVASEKLVVERALVAIYGCSVELVKDKNIADSVEDLAKSVKRIDREILYRLLMTSETDCLRAILQRTEPDVQLTNSARKAVEMQHGPGILRLLLRLSNSEANSIGFSMLDIGTRQHATRYPPAIPEQVKDVDIKAEAVQQNLNFEQRPDISQFSWQLQLKKKDTQYQLLKAASANTKSAHDLVRLLLEDMPIGITIGEDVLCAAAANEGQGANTVDILLNFASAIYQITGKVLDTASKNTTFGPLVLRKLIMSGRIPARQNMSYDVGTMCMAAFDPIAGPEMVTLLLRHEQPRYGNKDDREDPEMAIVAFRAAAQNDKLCSEVIRVLDKPLDELPVQGPFLEELYANIHCRSKTFEVLVSSLKEVPHRLEYLIAAAKLSDDDEFKRILLDHQVVGQNTMSAKISLLEATQLGFSSFTAPFFVDTKEIKRVIDEQDDMGRTALSYAAAHGNISQVRRLLNAGASVDHPDSIGRTPLCWAAFMNQMAVAGLLVDAGAQLLGGYCTCVCGRPYDLKRRICANWDCDFRREVLPSGASPYKVVKLFMDAING